MSFILDALTRSQQERQRKTVPGLQTVHLPPAANPGPTVRARHSALAGALIVAGAVLAWWMWWGADPQGQVAANQPGSGGRASQAAAPELGAGTTYDGLPAGPSASSAQTRPPRPTAVAAHDKRRDVRDTLASLESSIVIIEAPPLREEASAPGTAVQAAPLPRAAAPAVRRPDDTEGWALITPDTVDSRKATGSVTTAAAVADGSQPLYGVHELPDDVRAQLPDVVFSGHLYSSDPAARMIIVDGGRTLSEGQRVSGDLYLEEITNRGVILAFRGYRFSAGVVGNWALK